MRWRRGGDFRDRSGELPAPTCNRTDHVVAADAVRNLCALGVPFEGAVGAATTVPARLLGRCDLGVLEVGRRADVVVLDDRLEIISAASS